MALFAISTTPDAKKYMEECKTRMQRKDFIKNPYETEIIDYKNTEGKQAYLISITPQYPQIWKIGMIWMLGIYLILQKPFTAWQIPGVIMTSTGILWHKITYQTALRIGLYKHNKKARIQKEQTAEALKAIKAQYKPREAREPLKQE